MIHYEIPASIFHAPELSASEKFVWTYLHKTKVARLKTIAIGTSLSRRSVQYHIRTLESFGYIKVHREAGERNGYETFDVPAPPR